MDAITISICKWRNSVYIQIKVRNDCNRNPFIKHAIGKQLLWATCSISLSCGLFDSVASKKNNILFILIYLVSMEVKNNHCVGSHFKNFIVFYCHIVKICCFSLFQLNRNLDTSFESLINLYWNFRKFYKHESRTQ